MRVRVGNVLYKSFGAIEGMEPALRDGILELALNDMEILESSSRFYGLGGQKVEIWYRSTRNSRRKELLIRRKERGKWGYWGV